MAPAQTKPVTVYRMVAASTVDEAILKMAERKSALDAAVLEGPEGGPRAEGEDGGGGDKNNAKTMAAMLAEMLQQQA